MIKRLGGVALLVMSVLGVSATPASAAPKLPDIQCGVPITTSVKLREDLTCPTQVVTATAFDTAITINLNHHTLTVPAPGGPCDLAEGQVPSGCTVETMGGPVTIENGVINGGVGFPAPVGPVRPPDLPPAAGGTLRNVTINGFVSMDAVDQTVTNSTINGEIVGFGRNIVVTKSVVTGLIEFLGGGDAPGDFNQAHVSHNKVVGGRIEMQGDSDFGAIRATVTDNVVTNSPGDGIVFSAVGNQHVISVSGSITGNAVVGAHDRGIALDDVASGLFSSNVSDNTVTDSGGNGFELRATGTPGVPQVLTFKSNTATDNGGHGIFLGQDPNLTVISGTGNRAAGNLTPPQCVGVSCDPGGPAVPPVLWSDPATITYGTPLGPAQLNGTSTVPGTFTYTPGAGTILPATAFAADNHISPPATLTAIFVPKDTTRYQTITLTRTLEVDGARPVITWAKPADLVYGTPLGPDQLNATASVPGTFTYSPPLGTRLPTGIRELVAVFTPDDQANYERAGADVQINVVPPPNETVTWNNPADIVFGTVLGPDQLNAVASVPGTFRYTPAAGTRLNVGADQVLQAVFTPDDLTTYAPITTNVSIRVVAPPSETLTWATPAPIAFGTPLGPDQLDALASVPGKVTYSRVLGTILDPGTQQLTATFVPTDTNHFIVLSVTVSLTVMPPATVPTNPFGAAQAFPSMISIGSEVVDLDGDGHQDLVTTEAAESAFGVTLGGADVKVSLGHGDGTFDTGTIYPIGGGIHGLAVADVNGDGNLDVLATNGSDNTLSVLLGRGDGTLASASTYPVGADPGSIVVSDLDGDGRPDVAVSNYGSTAVSVLLGTATGLAPKVDYATGGAPASMVGVDVNGDGHLDLITSNFSSNNLSILFGTGAGTFAPRVDRPTCGLPGAFATGDLNGDGHLDIAMACGGGLLSIFDGDGTGNFSLRGFYTGPPSSLGVALGDINGDGHLDLAMGGVLTNSVTVRMGVGDGTFSPAITIPTSIGTFNLTLADVNGDGRLDLVVDNALGGSVSVYLNQSAAP